MTNTITWWQFSDIHWPANPQPERTEFTRELLVELGGNTLHRHDAPDFIVITGDIALSGMPEEYESVTKHFVGPLKDLLSTPQSDTEVPIFSIPGNHDLNREEARYCNPERIIALSSPEAIDDFLSDSRAVRAYLQPFRDYEHWVHQNLGPETCSPLSWTSVIPTPHRRVLLTGINSAWASYYSELVHEQSDERRLLIGQRQLALDAGEGDDIRILLSHHPLDWLNRDVCGRTEQRLRSKFDLMLFGHVHSAKDLAVTTGIGGSICFVPSPLLYGRPYEDSLEYARAFVVNTLDTDSGEVRSFYYRYSDTIGNARFLPYTDLYADPERQQYFSAHLRNTRPVSTLVAGSVAASDTKREISLVEIADHSDLARVLGGGDRTDRLAPGHHAVSIFREILGELDPQLAGIIGVEQREASSLAIVLVSESIARGDSGMQERCGLAIMEDLAKVQSQLEHITTGDSDLRNSGEDRS